MGSIAVNFYHEPEPIPQEKPDNGAIMKVFGVGGGGGNTVKRMIESGVKGVEYVVLNTDSQALALNLAPDKVQLGKSGRGAGANPNVGKKEAEQSIKEIEQLLEGTELLFIVAGMGGGTGTGASPIIAEIARKVCEDILIIAIVTKPFEFEGLERARVAEEGIERLSKSVDTLVVIPNEKLLTDDSDLSIDESWALADTVVAQATSGISGLLSVPGQVNADLKDLQTVMRNGGKAVVGIGRASGDDRGTIATRRAIECPLVEHASIEGAKKVLLGVVHGPNEKMKELNKAGKIIQAAAGGKANMIFGTARDENIGDELIVTVIATGFDQPDDQQIEIEQSSISEPESHLEVVHSSGEDDPIQLEEQPLQAVTMEADSVPDEEDSEPFQLIQQEADVIELVDETETELEVIEPISEEPDQEVTVEILQATPEAESHTTVISRNSVSQQTYDEQDINIEKRMNPYQAMTVATTTGRRKTDYSYRLLPNFNDDIKADPTDADYSGGDLNQPAYYRYFGNK